MRYNFGLKDVPRNCACGSAYLINHCLTYKRGFVNFRHNTVRDTIYSLAKDVYTDVKLEPVLLPVKIFLSAEIQQTAQEQMLTS